MEILILLLTLIGSLLTFFSGFGLGTLLTPAFLLYFPTEIAIALTAIIHFANNILKLIVVVRSPNWKFLVKFGIPAMIFALLGAWALKNVSSSFILMQYYFFGNLKSITLQKTIIGSIILLLTSVELFLPKMKFQINPKYISIGGALSGFFGGFSGNQGALRSVFLVRSGLNKEEYVGTTVVISTLVDIVRLPMYLSQTNLLMIIENRTIVIYSIVAAFIGVLVGNIFLKKITVQALNKIIAICLIIFSIGMMAGLV